MRHTERLDKTGIEKMMDRSLRELEKSGVEGEARLRFQLALEELLIECREQCGETASATLRMKRKGRQLTTVLVTPRGYSAKAGSDTPLSALLSNWKTGTLNGRTCRTYTLTVVQTRMDLLRFVWKYTRPHKWWFFLGVLTQAASVAIEIIAPLITAKVITSLSQGLLEEILMAAGSLLLINAISDVVNIACNRAYNVVYNKTLTLLETDLVQNALRITTRCLDRKGSGLFIQRLTQDTSQLATGFSTMADLFSQSIEKIGILAAVLIVNPIAFAAMVGILAVQTVIETVRTRIHKVDDRAYRTANEKYTDFVNEMIHGAKDVKLTHSESAFESELVRRIADANNKRMKMQNRSAVFSLARMEIGSFGTYAFIALLVLLMSQGRLTAADALILFNYRSNVGVSSIQLVGQVMEFLRGLELSTERVIAIIHSPEFPKETFGTQRLDAFSGGIRFEHVRFSYDRQISRRAPGWVLKDMDFEIRPGESVAFVGASGCGKSTVFNLISRLYEVNEGTIRFDGVDIQDLDVESVRGNLAVVCQNPYLFQLSIRDNLRLAKPDMTEEEMKAACRMACIDRDIESKPEGYDTVIDENGVNLSGGQRQRLAIARALLKNAPVLMLDEATSALDNMTQAKIQEAIANIRGNRTVITIAHRLSTVIGADRILYVEDGRILEQGSHAELLERCEPYRKLYEAELGNV